MLIPYESDSINALNNTLPFPFIMLDKGVVVYANESANKVLAIAPGSKITDIIPYFSMNLAKQQVSLNGEIFFAFAKHLSDKIGKSLITVSFIQKTDFIENAVRDAEKVLVSLIFIDNYDEVLESIEEIKRPILTALIDRKINALAQKVSGIVRKFEKDKYLFLFSNDKLEILKSQKFEILSQVREINMGNKLPVTLSIGIGLDGDSLTQSMEFARAAIDLALGRGGDQVLIKDKEKYYFFGGISKEIGNNTRVKARIKTYAFSELVGESSNVIIMGHRNIDLDCLGAAIGVYKMVSSLGKDCKIILGSITTNIKYLYERLCTENDYKNNVFISKEEARKNITENTLIVIVDAHRPSILEDVEILKTAAAKKIVVIDHHRKAAEFIDNALLTYHDPSASSTCELITEMLQYLKNKIKLRPVEADALLAGITVDTKNFTVKTGTKTFEAAAYLRRNGSDSVKVRMLFKNDLEAFKAKAMAVNNAEIFQDNIAISICPSNIENPALIAAQAADELLDISGIEASFVLSSVGEKVNISARSLSGINVQVIMEKLDGGGHQTVAGVQIEGVPEDEVLVMLKDAINNYLQEVSK